VDDFSKARNYSLEQATGDWILILDGDDEFERRDAGLLKELINKPDAADIYIFNTICYIGNKAGADRIFNVNIRLFRNIPELRYQGRIHESIISQKSDVRMESVGITIYHYGYLNSNVNEHDKRKRNMRILEQQLQEQPDNPYFLFCMGNEYFALGQLEKLWNTSVQPLKNATKAIYMFPSLS
jgi:glycosyltransferase involved in cell wall biosynthesis